ncbi:MinD/ParA family ATP-binding protein [Agromyces mangrovi Wang et al. 2018]|uniref:MinD/ParA family ATP-binding protein n=1 Tax=Agromyces mangrovi TaxID=1858653 RepID=UPI0025743BAD|nr:MinD/ParA family protein [Agromyces mangrovi]BDZ66194.1 hypothetical protein GCM10025877_31320 [Agromyces mangrovi]
MADDRNDTETDRSGAGTDHRGGASARTGAHSSRLPERLTIQVDLPPAPVREIPEDEAAVAIDDVAVNPGELEGRATPTQSIPLASAESARRLGARESSPYRALLAADERRERERERAAVAQLDADEPAELEPAVPADLPETSDSLTPDRLIDTHRAGRPAPQGGLNRFLYEASFHTINLGDSAKVRAHKAMNTRIQRRFLGGARFVPVLTRKGGVGKTTVTTLLGMALANAREDRVIAIDANPDRGTLAERVDRQTRETVRDVVGKASTIGGYTDFSRFVSRDGTRLDILASDTDPNLSEAFDDNDYNVVANLAARYYSMVLTDCGTGIVHSVMRATLQRADAIVVVSGGSVDEARLASETLTWLESNGFGDLVKNAVVAINLATQGTHLVKVDEIEAHFQSRVREIVRIPYDPQLAAGSVVHWDQLRPITREAARELAALVVEGIPEERVR